MSKNKPKLQPNNVKYEPLSRDLQRKFVETSSTHSNLSERIVYLTESKIRICLMNNIKNLEDRRAWQIPLGILLTICIVFPTTEFKDWIFSRFTWQAVFVMAGIICLVWLVYSLFKMPKRATVDDIVDELIPTGTEINPINKISKKSKNS